MNKIDIIEDIKLKYKDIQKIRVRELEDSFDFEIYIETDNETVFYIHKSKLI